MVQLISWWHVYFFFFLLVSILTNPFYSLFTNLLPLCTFYALINHGIHLSLHLLPSLPHFFSCERTPRLGQTHPSQVDLAGSTRSVLWSPSGQLRKRAQKKQAHKTRTCIPSQSLQKSWAPSVGRRGVGQSWRSILGALANLERQAWGQVPPQLRAYRKWQIQKPQGRRHRESGEEERETSQTTSTTEPKRERQGLGQGV